MKHSKTLVSFALLGGLLVGVGAAATPASAQMNVSCPLGYDYLPGVGCEPSGVAPSAAYSYPFAYSYPYAYYAPLGVNGGFGFRGGDHDFHRHEGFRGGGEHGHR
jgi:hypothetical protein